MQERNSREKCKIVNIEIAALQYEYIVVETFQLNFVNLGYCS
jgi:hypothetical protein